MEESYNDITSSEINETFHFFNSSLSTVRTTPPLYADDPWTAEGAFDYQAHSVGIRDLSDTSFYSEEAREQANSLFGCRLTPFNVLLGVDIPDIYYKTYVKFASKNDRIHIHTLEDILRLSGLPFHEKQKVISLVIPSGEDFLSKNDFDTFLALIACGQNNMDLSLETIYKHRNDLPIPSFEILETSQLEDDTKQQLSTIECGTAATKGDELRDQKKTSVNSITNSNSSLTIENNEEIEQINCAKNLKQQESMNQWFKDLDHINVTRTVEKEGTFLFKHVNYKVESEKMDSSVLRRFSDFFWLRETLMRRYPLRILPNIPPKKLGGRNDMFEERRRKGLSRFINAVRCHPMLGIDEVVVAFLNHPSDMRSWKKVNEPSLDEEFVRKLHDIDQLERSIPMDLDDRVIRMRKRLSISCLQYENMCLNMHQMNRLKKALSKDYIRYSIILNSVSDLDKQCLLSDDCQGCPQLVNGYKSLTKSMQQAGILLNKQAIASGDSMVEQLKSQREILEAAKELLDRWEKPNILQSETLARQMARYKRGKVISPEERENLTISNRHHSESNIGLDVLHQREIFNKHCLLEELSFLHKHQAHISNMYNTLARNEIKYTSQWSDHWKQLESATNEMPNNPHDFF